MAARRVSEGFSAGIRGVDGSVVSGPDAQGRQRDKRVSRLDSDVAGPGWFGFQRTQGRSCHD